MVGLGSVNVAYDNSKHWNMDGGWFLFVLFPGNIRPTETKLSSHSTVLTGLFNIRKNAGFVGADMVGNLAFWLAAALTDDIFGLLRSTDPQPVGSRLSTALHSPLNLEIAANDQWQSLAQHQDHSNFKDVAGTTWPTWWTGSGCQCFRRYRTAELLVYPILSLQSLVRICSCQTA